MANDTNQARILPSTVDNRYSPFTDWDRWYTEDLRLGYDTLGLWYRLMPPHSEMDAEGAEAEGLRLIMHYNFSGKHFAAVPEDYDPYLKPPL